ncbi:MAG: class I SAM-dependent methyltransferase [Alphaproteobacteria bacterium]|nr:class I SAM-dependent methyltransferase [Alphaproteobacteria bacterium]
MDGIYRYQRYIYDATRKYYLLGRDRMLDRLRPPPGGTILEVGCGTGRNLILAARRYPEARLYGFDISKAMLETARASIERENLADRITVVEGDATDFDMQALFGVPHADRVFISYSLSMIPPWQEAIREAVAALSPGGELHVVDFGQQSGWPKWFEKLMFAWLRKFSVYPRADLEAEMRTVAESAGATSRFETLYRDYARYGVIAAKAI